MLRDVRELASFCLDWNSDCVGTIDGGSRSAKVWSSDGLNNRAISIRVLATAKDDDLVESTLSRQATRFTQCVKYIVLVSRQFDGERFRLEVVINENLISTKVVVAAIGRTVFANHKDVVSTSLHQRHDNFLVTFQQDFLILGVGTNNFSLSLRKCQTCDTDRSNQWQRDITVVSNWHRVAKARIDIFVPTVWEIDRRRNVLIARDSLNVDA